MPELPEVETVRAGLATRLAGQRIAAVEVYHPRATRRSPGGTDAYVGALRDARIGGVARRGKYLWLEIPAAHTALVFHLGMSGQLLIDPRVDMPRTHLRARYRVGPHEMWFVDQRTFGHTLVSALVPTSDGALGGWGATMATVPEAVAHIARDPLDSACDLPATAKAMRRRSTAVKRALLDQGLISGIGNIYADEALWRARMHPRRATATLRQSAALALLSHAREVMREALAAGGTSFDALYVDVSGRSGWFERRLDAYGRAGLPCRRCGRPLVRESFMNRSSVRCPRCQRRPSGAHLAP
ncbi:MAG: bifunctional DNA-formamidopyrimidine glycosylase/DNA-(apurinic or apyrimidinic site) lyase [Bowdeniella nasicola]|nr:bifunctional DNA-formamidopyrimidine glycosylase/DNA-(apurinic or apyrimidinic site) lyase [Bowdeniella nasicola]